MGNGNEIPNDLYKRENAIKFIVGIRLEWVWHESRVDGRLLKRAISRKFVTEQLCRRWIYSALRNCDGVYSVPRGRMGSDM